MARTATRTSATTAVELTDHGLAPLTEQAITDQTDAGSFKRGRGYARSGHIFRAVRRENTLRSRCHGSSGGPYLVEATLAKTGQTPRHNPLTFSCDCPRGGFCKHVVALLLTWIDRPESFDVRPPVAERLANKSQEELVAIIELMLGENPDLEDVLDLPVPVALGADDATVDEAAIRRQIAAVMPDDDGYDEDRYPNWDHDVYGFDEGYGVPAGDLAKLERIVSLAEAYMAVGHWQNTLRVAATFIEEVASNIASLEDESGEIDELIVRCDQTLSACLEAQDGLPAEQRLAKVERLRLIDVLLLIWETNINAGGRDLSQRGPEAIARTTTAEEQQRAIDAIREMLASLHGNKSDRSWDKRAALEFLSLLRGESGFSDEELLDEYRNAELWSDAAGMLLRLGRTDEAIGLAIRRLILASALTSFADQLLETGDSRYLAQAITVVDDRLWEKEGQNALNDQTLREWLERRYAEHGQPGKALELVRDRFKTAPSHATYDAARRIALLPDQSRNSWAALRKDLLATLRKRGDWSIAIEIYLDEDEVSEAIGAVEQLENARRSGRGGPRFDSGAHPQGYTARVAAAAETNHPADAVRLYQRLADEMIAGKNRISYRQAASYLARIKHVMATTGETDAWPPLISEVRGRYKTFRALQEELDALGLR